MSIGRVCPLGGAQQTLIGGSFGVSAFGVMSRPPPFVVVVEPETKAIDNYVLLFCGTTADQEAFEGFAPDELAARYREVGRWFAHNRARIRGANQLQPREAATTVRHDAGGPLITDGPFIEGNELIGGYAEVEVADLDEALAMAKSWPGGGAVEVRPVVDARARP